MVLELHKIRRELKLPSLEFKSLHRGGNSMLEHLIEVPTQLKVPNSYILVNCTKQFNRYHTPVVLAIQDRICRAKDELKIEFKLAWIKFLLNVDAAIHLKVREIVQNLGYVDVLIGLAQVSAQPGYVQPLFEKGRNRVELSKARHPLVELYLEKKGISFVPNNVQIGCNFSTRSCEVVTGIVNYTKT
jgi:DNA mismatch repair protein MSH3